MKLSLFVFVVILIAFIAGHEVSKFREKKARCQEVSDSRIASLDFTLSVLETMRADNNKKALQMLEIGLLIELPSVGDEERVIGWNDNMQAITERISTYCRQYGILDENTNLPSHIVAKNFLRSKVR